ncbi:MAG: bifunctional 2-keto-4-hydroxyglutarate aldolase/2-keto-3-deoxy-6-phosphogluconate aldolase [Thermicanus sp.]|nr:bifunctional 2-keto-4-hydroxyglutarate aldolase/2-keto-3-deoxy-6-phosphogluconate aldolase [Thermicanus sp.]
MKKWNILQKLFQAGVVAVIRSNSAHEAKKTAEACIEGGVTAIEVTFTVPGAARLITELTEAHQGLLTIGAGTVLDAETARLAILAGAEFIVSPGFDKETALLSNRYQIPYIPGCMTITEMVTAMEYGASILKLFPSQQFGPGFIKAVKGPLPQVEIMPSGGVTLSNAKEWIQNGAVAISVGGELTQPASKGDYAEVRSRALAFQEQVRIGRGVE